MVFCVWLLMYLLVLPLLVPCFARICGFSGGSIRSSSSSKLQQGELIPLSFTRLQIRQEHSSSLSGSCSGITTSCHLGLEEGLSSMR